MAGFDFQIGIVRQSRVVRLDDISARVVRWCISAFICEADAMVMRCIIPNRHLRNAMKWRVSIFRLELYAKVGWCV